MTLLESFTCKKYLIKFKETSVKFTKILYKNILKIFLKMFFILKTFIWVYFWFLLKFKGKNK